MLIRDAEYDAWMERHYTLDLQGILSFYLPLHDFAAPTWAQIYVLFQSIGSVAKTPTAQFPNAFVFSEQDEAVWFHNREQAWAWYLVKVDLLKPTALMPWELPSVGGLRVVDGAVVDEVALEQADLEDRYGCGA